MKNLSSSISEKDFLFENEDVIVVNKPARISTHPLLPQEKDTLIGQLLLLRPEIQKIDPGSLRPGIVHRLDRDTSGILLVAKNKNACEYLIQQFSERKVEKRYTALVWQPLAQQKGVIESLMGRDPGNKKKQKCYSLLDPEARRRNLREALTSWKVLKNFREWCLIEALPKTGRRHQIRAHLASIGHPIAGDRLYGFKDMPIPEGLTRHFLHSSYLKFTGPDGNTYEFESPLPEELEQVITKLES